MSNKTRIVRGDIDLELYPDEVIAQTLQGPNIGDLTTRGFNFTNTFKIPGKSQVNQEAYEGANKIQSETDVPYTQETIKVIQNGIEIESNGKERLVSAGEDFDIMISSGAIGFFEAIGDNMLSDLDDFVVTTGYTESTNRRAATSGVIYPVAYFGLDGSDQFVGFPFVYDISILNSIISNAGYTGAGSIFTNPKFIKTVTGAFASEKGYVSSFIDARRISVNVITPQALSVTAGAPISAEVNFTGISDAGTNPYGYWDGTSRYITNDPRIPADAQLFNIMFRVTLNITVTGGSADIYFVEQGPVAEQLRTIAIGATSGTYSYEDNSNWNAGTYNGTSNYGYIRFEYNSGTTVNITVNAGTLQIEPAPNPLGFTFGFVPPGTSDYYDDVAGLLPDIKQKDFIKDIMINYGLIATEKNGVITFTSFDEIIADRANALDWTQKRVPDRVRDKLTYTPFMYGQRNIFRYTNVDAFVSTDFGIGEFLIDNDNIKETAPIYDSIYAAARMSFKGNKIVADVNIFDNTGVSFPNMFNNASNRKLLVRDKYSYEASVQYMDGGSYSDYKAVYFDDPNQTYSMRFQQYIDDNYPLFVGALQKAKFANWYYLLDETDIAGFDFLRLVFDKDAYFLVNRINNYVPGVRTLVQQFKV